MSINEIQDEIIEEFNAFDDWMDRYQLLVDYGNELPSFDEADRTDQNLIDGCQSKVWFTAQLQGDKIVYTGDSDAILVKGIVALLIRFHDLGDQSVSYYITLRESDYFYSVNTRQYLRRLYKPALLPVRQVDLRDVSVDHHL